MLWIEARLGGKVETDNWLDGYPLSVGIGLCEALGADLSPLSPHAEFSSFEVGYNLFRQGPDAVFNEIKALKSSGRPWRSPTHSLLTLHSWLKGAFHKPDLRGLRECLADILRQLWAASPGREFLSEPVLSRESYDLEELARFSGEPVEALQRRFAPHGTPFVQKALADVFIEHLPALADDRCCEIFSAAPPILDALKLAYPTQPLWEEAGWTILSLQRLLDDLLVGAEPVGKMGWGWRHLPQAAEELNLPLSELIMRLSTQDRTLRVGRLSRRFGFEAVVVNIQAAEGGAGDCEISAETFAEWQGVEPGEMLSFFRRGLSPARITKRTKGRKDQILLSPQQIRDFHEKFISFRSLALRLRLSWDKTDKLLRRNRIVPVPDCRQIYDLGALRKLLAA